MTLIEYTATVKRMNQASNLYYNTGDTTMSDKEYDRLQELVVEYEATHTPLKDSPTQDIDAAVTTGPKIPHLSRMWSMGNVYNTKQLKDWKDNLNIDTPTYLCEPKCDGVALNLIYKNGMLVNGITRGDGKIGKDVTVNVKKNPTIPQVIDIKDTIEIHGEIVITNDDFIEINKQRILNNKKPFSNSRNLASGLLQNFKANQHLISLLKFYPWGVGKNKLMLETHSGVMATIGKKGFLTIPHRLATEKFDFVYDFYKYMNKKIPDIDIPIDGMVVRINDINQQEALGYTRKYPKHLVAFKFHLHKANHARNSKMK